jgi:hypothetical protein
MIKSMAMENFTGPMADATAGIGQMANNTEGVYIKAAIVLNEKVNGLMGKKLNGSMNDDYFLQNFKFILIRFESI